MKNKAIDTALLPLDPDSGEPLLPRPQPGYYSGFSTLSQKPFWDHATRKLVIDRVETSAPIRFFTQQQADFWSIVFDHLIPQTDRTPDRRIPILPAVDKRLFLNKTNGYRFADMPHDREVYLLGIEAINEEAQHRYRGAFVSLPHLQQDIVLKTIHDGKPKAAAGIWKRMSVHRFWQQIIHDAVDAYYAHPWAWDEIGFGGPAYPRAYMRLERGEAEPWEVEEQSYAWVAPSQAVSGERETTHEFHTESLQHRSHGRKNQRPS
ncbi:MAG: gluconate 2-dehydrogenase subunit 3 family protein [Silvibacterium sp.]